MILRLGTASGIDSCGCALGDRNYFQKAERCKRLNNLVPDPTAGDNLLSKHGRGILLISRLMDSLEFRLNGRQLIMRKRTIRSH